MMRKYFFIFPLILFISSCANQLDLYPDTAISPDEVTNEDLPALRVGMYNDVQNDPRTRSFIMFDILGGTLAGNSGNALDVINSMLSPLNSTISSSWNGYYSALYQVNNILAIASALESSESRDRTIGEAYYFRAYIYYCLLTRWGGVPILRENTMDKPARNTPEEVWAFIEEDLNSASDLLQLGSNYYYVSKDAVTALQARVMLSQGKMDQAASYAEQLITSGRYGLDQFEKIFRKEDNSEIIFAFENVSEESNINISDLFYTYAHPNKGQGSYRVTPDIPGLFSAQDKRRDISITNIVGTDCINKYPSGQTGRDPVIVSRLAEMYLISAEAQGRTAGISRLNELRAFRGLGPVSPASEAGYTDAILLERKRELLGENFMFYDLVRLGKAVEVLGIQPHQTRLPIPGKELQLNENLTPNPGY